MGRACRNSHGLSKGLGLRLFRVLGAPHNTSEGAGCDHHCDKKEWTEYSEKQRPEGHQGRACAASGTPRAARSWVTCGRQT
jgi:hypothetical protein